MAVNDTMVIAATFGASLERVGAGWVIGGSLASSLHGVPRSTVDVDIVVSLAPDAVASLAREATAFSMDIDALREQIVAGRSYNVFHNATTTKLDLFPAVGAFERSQIARAMVVLGARLMTPEDILLAKLRWFRLGNEVSDRQWGDVLGIVSAQRTSMDDSYLRRWAADLGVSDLLERARADRSGGF